MVNIEPDDGDSDRDSDSAIETETETETEIEIEIESLGKILPGLVLPRPIAPPMITISRRHATTSG